jgi:hypothetical protein
MEILSLLRLNGKRIVALSTLGALTGGLAAVAVSRQPATYEANVTVFVSQALPTGASSFDIGPLVSDFTEALRLPEVKKEAADTLALSERDLFVTATRNGTDGGSVRVVGAAASAEDAEAIVVALSKGAMKALGQQQVDRAAGLEAERATQADTARATRDKLLADSGYADPEQVYNDVLNEANRLSLASSDPTTQLVAEARTAAAAEATRLRSQLPALRAKAEEYRVAQKKLELAEDNLNAAAKDRIAAEATMASATSEGSMSVGETLKVSPMSAMVQAVAAALIGTFGAGIAVFFGLDGLRRRSEARRARRAQAKAAPSDPDAGMSPAEAWALGMLDNRGGGETRPPVADRDDVADAFGNELVEVGATSPDGTYDSWGNPRSMFTKPMRANGSEPAEVDVEPSAVAVADGDAGRDEVYGLDDDTVEASASDVGRSRRRARRRH